MVGSTPGGDLLKTFATGFDPRHNSLNFLRLVFALLVVVSHASPLGGYGDDPRLAGQGLGLWAVAGFFAISGYLIAVSRMHTSFREFVFRRFLRIYPGYIVCLLVTVLFFAPFSVLIGPGSISWHSAGSYVGSNILLKVEQNGIRDTLTTVPYGDAWNGSLWTLFYEFVCYLLIGALLTVVAGWRKPSVIAAFCVTAAAAVYEAHRGATGTIADLTFLAAIFLAGSLLALYADRVPIDWRLGVGTLVLLPLSSQLHFMPVLGAIAAAYACLWLGVVLPFQRVGRRNDISYGVYIYAFPVQQLLALSLGHRLPLELSVLLAIACTLPFAAASWFLVEKRALALKHRRPIPAHAATAVAPRSLA
jgi:peptidoglycan/LPS O-acetylase OafA/YrhL